MLIPAVLRVLGHQRWLRGRTRLVSALYPPDLARKTPFEVEYDGLKYRGHLANQLDRNVYFFGGYAPDEIALLRDLSALMRDRRGTVTLYDVGANVGHHTMLLSAHVDEVIAFEPMPANRAALEDKIVLNGLPNVRVFPVALSDRAGSASMIIPNPTNPGEAQISTHPGGVVVETVRGDDLVRSARLPRIDLLKVDVEGHEPEVLAGLAETLRRDRPCVLLEASEVAMRKFGGADGLRSTLYSDHVLFSLRPTRRSYRLEPYNPRSWEVLCAPAELAEAVGRLPA